MAKKQIRHLREGQTEFQKVFSRLCDTNSAWQVWSDFVEMTAISISNAVEIREKVKQEREARYMNIIGTYTKKEQEIFPKLVSILVQSLQRNSEQDFLGEMFMSLELGNHWKGQFFTPYSVCKAMAAINIDDSLDKVAQKGYIAINDPACGAGATLIAAADIMYNEQHVNYQTHALFTAQDIDFTTALMCYIQLSLFGCPGYVHVGNTLTEPMTGHVLFGDGGENTWYTPMYFSNVWEGRRQCALMDKWITQDMLLGHKVNAPEAFHAPVEPPEPDPVIIQVSGKKARRNPKGQLMLDI